MLVSKCESCSNMQTPSHVCAHDTPKFLTFRFIQMCLECLTFIFKKYILEEKLLSCSFSLSPTTSITFSRWQDNLGVCEMHNVSQLLSRSYCSGKSAIQNTALCFKNEKKESKQMYLICVCVNVYFLNKMIHHLKKVKCQFLTLAIHENHLETCKKY